MKPAFPFTAIVGQHALKRALMIAAVDAQIGGVLALGDRGTGKSTAVRALAAVLPEIEVVEGCPYNRPPGAAEGTYPALAGESGTISRAAPVVDLPLGATEDRVLGALDLEAALTRGERRFEPGLLAKANRGFLYIDEVNLLEDHIVDLLLDVAASGACVVEREGLSVRHPARFVIVGSGNPEEGELRPQLLDRFGLSVEVRTPREIADRIEVVRRRDDYERDPEAFLAAWAGEQQALRGRIVAARTGIDSVAVPDMLLEKAAELCIALGTDGLRGELTAMRAARALAALDGRTEASDGDLRAVAPMALGHRLRRDPLDESGSAARLERAMAETLG